MRVGIEQEALDVCFFPPGCSTMRLPQSTGKGFTGKNVLNIRNAGGYQNYPYESNTSTQFKRRSYKNSKCANSEIPQVEDCSLMNTKMTLTSVLKLFYVFIRPYPCVGIILGVISSSLIAIESLSDISLPFLMAVLKAAAAFICLTIYGSGVNQVFDIDIDKINKPNLALASGEMKMETGITIVSGFALMAFAIGIGIGSTPLLWGIFLYFFLLSGYSVNLPFLRWKSFAIGAASSMLAGSGIVFPVSSYLYIQTNFFGRQANFPRPLAFGTIVLSLFFLVAALFKDIPDLEGDQKFGIHSLATRLGQKKVFWICVYLLEIVYIFAIIVGATSSYQWSKLITVSSHSILSLILWKQAQTVDFKSSSETQSFYMFIWKLIYTEYLLIPLVR